MSRFTTNKLKEIELKRTEEVEVKKKVIIEGKETEIIETEEKEIIEYVRIPEKLSYEQVMRMTKPDDTMEMSKIMLLECIKEWTILDDNGVIPPITEENILRLDVPTIEIISEEIRKLLVNNQDKKK